MTGYAIVVQTVDRTPKANYLGATLANLTRAGLWRSVVPFTFAIVDGGSPDLTEFVAREIRPHVPSAAWPRVRLHASLSRRTPNGNAAETWRVGALAAAPWVLFLQDDVDVCARFVESVDAWLTAHARTDRRVYPLGCPYPLVDQARKAGKRAADYPVAGFYGSQALLTRHGDAESIWRYLEAHPQYQGTDQSWDLLLHGWATSRYPAIAHFLTPAPGFAQHVGRDSTLVEGRQGRVPFFEHVGWAGREWSYA